MIRGIQMSSVVGGDPDPFNRPTLPIGQISDGGTGYGLAVNDDAGGWATTNRTLRLTGLNTFTGNVTLGEGILEFDTVTNISGGIHAWSSQVDASVPVY